MLAAVLVPASARAAEPYFDVRDNARAVSAPADTRSFERRLGRQGVVDLDPTTRTPRVVARLDGTLTGPAGGAAATIGLRYVRGHLGEFGLDAADLATLEDLTVETAGGVRQVRWRQAVDGIPAADSQLRVNVTADGRVLSVLGSPAHDLPADTKPALTAGEAVRAVQDDVGVHRSLKRRGGVRKVTYDDDTTARLTLFAGQLSWRVTYRAASDAVYDSLVDARSGKVLRRANVVKSEAATGSVWDNHPGAAAGGVARATDLTPWLSSTTTLEGPYVHTFMDLDDDDQVGPGEEVAPAPYPFQEYPGTGCDVYACSWDGSSGSALVNRLQNAVQAFYLANRFHDHLARPPISFDGFSGADKIELHADDGAATGPDSSHRNNANMFTPREGESPVMQMYLWSGAYRTMNGGDDASIVDHEYTHGLTNRLVVDADGAGALNSAQAGAMGEGWSDFYAKDYLVADGLSTDTDAPGEVSMGEYTDRPGAHVIRNQALDCPVGAPAASCPGSYGGGTGGFTYGDFGRVNGSPEVHGDGEIWGETLWDLRTDLGSTTAVRLITAALTLSPPEPSFLDMRNAILQADAASGGADRDRIWAVFANRGMGFFASAKDGNDSKPLEDFSLPPAPGGPRATITGTVTDALAPNPPLAGMTVSIGGNANGPDALTATTDALGRYTLSVPPGSYASIIVRGPGYERKVASKTVAAGDTVTLDASLRRDWAARDGGASVLSTDGTEYTSYGCGPGAAVDDSQSTTWSTDYVPGREKTLDVELPQPVDLTQFGIDPAAGCGDDNSASLAKYRIEVAKADAPTTWVQAAAGTFSGGNGTINLVDPTADATDVKRVRLVLVSPRTAGATILDVTEFAAYGRPRSPAPVTRIVAGPTDLDSDSTPTFTFSSDQAGSSFECRLDGAATAACPSTFTPGPLADGRHTLQVTAISLNGARGNTVMRTWQINLGLPDTTLNEDAFAYTKSTSVSFSFAGVRQERFVCEWDGVVSDPCVATKTLAQGPHTFKVYAVNVNGADPSPPTRSFTVDSLAPQLSIASANIVEDAVSFAFSATDATAVTYACTFNGNTAPCTSDKTYRGLGDGIYTLHLVATDAAGNTASADRAVTIAAAAYDTAFTAAPPRAISDDHATFAFSSPSPDATFECSLDGADFAMCASPRELDDLAEGAHAFAVRAVGPGSRRDATPARLDFTLDRTAPETILTLVPSFVLTSRDFAVGFTANEPATFVCRLDGGDPVPCASPFLLSGLRDGTHTLEIAAIDAAGNVDATPERREFTVAVPQPASPPTATPTARPRALISASVAKTASLKILRRKQFLRFAVKAPAGAKISAELKLGSKSLGKTTRTASGTLTLTLDAKRLRAARKGATLTLRITATGTNLKRATRTLKIRLKT